MHPDRLDFGGYCCKKCHGKFLLGSKKNKKRHGVQCLQQTAPAEVGQAPPVAPVIPHACALNNVSQPQQDRGSKSNELPGEGKREKVNERKEEVVGAVSSQCAPKRMPKRRMIATPQRLHYQYDDRCWDGTHHNELDNGGQTTCCGWVGDWTQWGHEDWQWWGHEYNTGGSHRDGGNSGMVAWGPQPPPKAPPLHLQFEGVFRCALQKVFQEIVTNFGRELPIQNLEPEGGQQREEADDLSRPLPLCEIERELLRDTFHNPSEMDPSVSETAMLKWGSLLEWHDVLHLKQGHDVITSTFKHGIHRGMPIEELTRQLLQGETIPENIPPLVAARFSDRIFVIFGNRRLHAMKEFARAAGCKVCAAVLVHDHPFAHLEPNLRHVFVLKALRSTSTQNGGEYSHVKRHQKF